MVKSLDKKEFKKIENSDKISILDFSASWCSPCKALEPAFGALSDEMKNYNFYEIDVDKEYELARRFEIMSVPTIIVFKKGLELGRINGFSGKDRLKQEILARVK